ncbi:MAG: PilZ domain-containing protein [Nitrospira sp.]|nr:PilZ domain-containing protein [Nitrospira sp.]
MTQFIARKDHRFRRLVPVRYLGVWMAGEGLIEDLSLSGSHINGNASVSLGMPLALQIFVPGDPNLLRVQRAIVKWVKGSNFGVEFDEPEPKVADRIGMTISRLAQTEHGAFRNR